MKQSVVNTVSEIETEAIGRELAERLFGHSPCFVSLSGPVGAGKTTFARGFIRGWLQCSKEALPEAIVSPSYNLVKTYGTSAPLAHLDLYRLESMDELENIGFEQYFYEFPCCLVEWLEKIPEASTAKPNHAVSVVIGFGKTPTERTIKIQDP